MKYYCDDNKRYLTILDPEHSLQCDLACSLHDWSYTAWDLFNLCGEAATRPPSPEVIGSHFEPHWLVGEDLDMGDLTFIDQQQPTSTASTEPFQSPMQMRSSESSM